MKIIFMGTGTSFGVPVVGCNCSVCCSKNQKNKRLRPSVFIDFKGFNFLIDTPPELRIQLLEYKIDFLDTIFFTHCHADHVYGLDDVRVFSLDKKINVYGKKDTLDEIKKIFPYVFKRTQKGGGKPKLKMIAIDKRINISGLNIVPLAVMHGNKKIYGYRFGDFAYIPDCSKIISSTYSLLNDLKVLAIDALRQKPHPTHFSLDQAIEESYKIKAKKTYFTHISHNIEHEKISRILPKNVYLAYDGLKIEI